MEKELKTYFLYDEEPAIEKDQQGNTRQVNRSCVLADLRKRKGENVILKYEMQTSDNLNIYRVYQEEGVICIHVSPQDRYNTMLKTILERQNTPKDEVNVTIYDGENYSMSTPYSGTRKSGNQLAEMIEFLKCIEKNGEIDHVLKTGKENLRYDFYTTDYEIIHIYVRENNEQVVRELDTFQKITIDKKAGLKKVLVGLGVALLVATPIVSPVAKDFVIARNEKMEQTDQIETNMKLIKSYYTRLQTVSSLNPEEMARFKYLIQETLMLMDENDVSYPLLEELKNTYLFSEVSYKTK